MTKELEKDISERFGGMLYDNEWKFENNHKKRYKMILGLEYLPVIAGAPSHVRKRYFLLKPSTNKGGGIVSWEIKEVSKWQGWIPWF